MPSLAETCGDVTNLTKRLPKMAGTRKSRVLIIDDDELTTTTFAQMLRLEGHEVRTTQDPRTGLADVAELGPDAIIVDLHMPYMDGVTFVRKLRQAGGAGIPVAMVTGDYAMPQEACDSLKDLGVTLCFKPLWLDDLVELTNKLLEEAQ